MHPSRPTPIQLGRVDPILAELTHFKLGPLLDLLAAALTSPGASFAAPSILVLFSNALRQAGGNKTPAIGRLGQLVTAAHSAVPDLRTYEDFIPLDPRFRVGARVGDRFLLVHPGHLEYPVSVVRNAVFLANIVDLTLIHEVGFGIRDLVELVLIQTNDCVGRMAETWQRPPGDWRTARPRISLAEIAAYSKVMRLAETAQLASSPPRAKRALEWATTKAETFTVTLAIDTPVIGPWLVVDSAYGAVDIPVGVLTDALTSCVGALVSLAAKAKPALESDLHVVAEQATVRLLSRIGQSGIGPCRFGKREIIGLIRAGTRHVLAVDMSDGLDLRATTRSVEHSLGSLRKVKPGSSLRTPIGRITLSRDSEIVPLLVHVGPYRPLNQDPDVALVHMAELEVMLVADQHARHEIFPFLQRLIARDGAPEIGSWGIIDVWSAWRRSPGLYTGARPVGAVYVGPGSSDEHWVLRAVSEPLERLLAELGLPALEDWNHIDPDNRWVLLVDKFPYQAWLVRTDSPTLAIRFTDPDTGPTDLETIMGLAQSLQIRTEDSAHLTRLISQMGRTHLEVHIVRRGRRVEDMAQADIAATRSGRITIEVDPDFLKRAIAERTDMQAVLGNAFCAGLQHLVGPEHSDAVDAIRDHWLSSPPSVVYAQTVLHYAANNLDDPVYVPAGLVARARTQMAAIIKAAGFKPQRIAPATYATFESQSIYPSLIQCLDREMAPFSADSLLRAFAVAIERNAAFRERRARAHPGSHLMPEPEIRAEALRDASQDAARQGRLLALVIERTLAHRPAGRIEPDEIDVGWLLAVGGLALESAMSSDQSHAGVMSVEAVITTEFEYLRRPSGKPQVDLVAWQAATAIEAVTTPGEEETPSQGDRLAELPPLPPEYQPIDRALRSAQGFGLTSLFSVLGELRAWPVTDESPFAVTTVDAMVDFVEEYFPIPKVELRAAIGALTLRATALLDEEESRNQMEHWKLEGRSHRLQVRPLVALDYDTVLLMPRQVGHALDIYMNYYRDGRLPWPEETMDRNLVKALNRYRGLLNRQLEAEVASMIGRYGLIYRTSVDNRKPAIIGLTKLSGEIDILAADPNTRTLYVIEIKDISIAFSPRQIAKRVEAFHGPGEYVDRLLEKAADISRDPRAVVASLGLKATGVWKVKPLMVTRRLEPAAFVRRTRVPFLTTSQLEDQLLRAKRSNRR
jgi:hypothetical protein